MAEPKTDGDHVTLQALCDGLQCRIGVIKWVDSRLSKTTILHRDKKEIIVNNLYPRCLSIGINKYLRRLQVPKRQLWLSLHGDAHFKSVVCSSVTPLEISQISSIKIIEN